MLALTEDEQIAEELEWLRTEVIEALARVDRLRRTLAEQPASVAPAPSAPGEPPPAAKQHPVAQVEVSRSLALPGLLLLAAAASHLWMWWLRRARSHSTNG